MLRRYSILAALLCKSLYVEENKRRLVMSRVSTWACSWIMLALMVPLLRAEDQAPSTAIQKERARYAGKWNVASLVIDGKTAAEKDRSKLIVLNQPDGAWTLQVEGRTIAQGTSTIEPAKHPKAIDLTP